MCRRLRIRTTIAGKSATLGYLFTSHFHGPSSFMYSSSTYHKSNNFMTCGQFFFSYNCRRSTDFSNLLTYTRTFVFNQFLRFLIFKFIDDSMLAFASSMPFGGYWRESTPTPQFFSLPLPLQLLCSWMCCIHVIVGINMATSAVYTIATALGIWAPHELPPMFGNFRQLYTVRKSWS